MSFSGGIAFPHAVEQKESTAGLPIENFTPAQLMIPLRQGIGEACVPVVEVGQTVQRGQLIGRAADGSCACIHSGVSGTVTAVSPAPTTNGTELCIGIQNDGLNTAAPPLQYTDSPAGLIALMEDAGLVGMGGAGFPTAQKYSTNQTVVRVLINGCECEPALTCDHRLMLQQTDALIRGAVALGSAVNAAVTICVEANKPDAVAALRAAAQETGVTVSVLPARYPQGGERQLIQAVTGFEVPAGAMPADCGVLVSNAATAVAMAQALAGQPLTHRLLTVSGQVKRPANLYVPVGTLFTDILAHCGGVTDEPVPPLFIAGGPMTGHALADLAVPVTKTTGGLLALPPLRVKEQNCMRCGGCARVCPSRLMPFVIDAAVIMGKLGVCADYHADQCISCGCCSFVCPAKRPLAARVTLARGTLRKQKEA